MEINVIKEDLLNILYLTQNIAGRRDIIPLLSNILLNAENGKLTIFATDLDIGIKSFTDAKITKEGSLSLQSKRFYEIIKEIPEKNEINIKATENMWAEVSCGKILFKMPCADPKDFPSFPEYEGLEYSSFLRPDFLYMVKNTIYASSDDELKRNMNGVFIEQYDDGRLSMVATDGHRLSYIEKKGWKGLKGMDKGVLIRKKGVLEIRRILEECSEDMIEIGITKNIIIFRTKNTQLFIRLTEEEFPKYKDFIPKEFKMKAHLKRKAFLPAIKRASILTGSIIPSVKLQFRGNILRLSTSSEFGESNEEFEIGYQGDDIDIHFNAKFLTEAISVIDEDVDMEMTDQESPVLLKGGEGYFSLIMPIRFTPS